MDSILFRWFEVPVNAIEVAALGAVFWQLFRLRRDILALLRVLRRIDRKIAEPAHPA
jgi:hypothetical protein